MKAELTYPFFGIGQAKQDQFFGRPGSTMKAVEKRRTETWRTGGIILFQFHSGFSFRVFAD